MEQQQKQSNNLCKNCNVNEVCSWITTTNMQGKPDKEPSAICLPCYSKLIKEYTGGLQGFIDLDDLMGDPE